MKKRKLSVISLILVLMIVLSACSIDNGLYRAMLKQQRITSFTSETNVKLEIDGENLDEDMAEGVEILKEILGSSELLIKQKFKSNDKRSKSLGEFTILTKNQEVLNELLSAWVNVDLTDKDKMELVQVYKLAGGILSSLSSDLNNKEYLIYDLNELIEYQAEVDEERSVNLMDKNYDEIMTWSYKIQGESENITREILSDMKLDFNPVRKTSTKRNGNDRIEYYELSLNNQELGKVLKEFLRVSLNNKKVSEYTNEYIEIIFKAMEMDDISSDELKLELESMPSKEVILEKLNSLIDKFVNYNILGKDGIKIKYGVNREGYIVEEKQEVDFRIDLEDIWEKLTNDFEELSQFKSIVDFKGTLGLKLTISSKLDNINSNIIELNMPELNEENSYSLVDLMKEIEVLEATIIEE